MTLTYQGTDAGKVTRTGTEDTDDPRDVIRRVWPLNWRTLKVWDQAGNIVGVIGLRKGRRCWAIASITDPEDQ